MLIAKQNLDSPPISIKEKISRFQSKGQLKTQLPHPQNTELNADLMSLDEDLIQRVSVIKELLPDLGEGFIAACLETYGRDTEAVTSRLFEDGGLEPPVDTLDRQISMYWYR